MDSVYGGCSVVTEVTNQKDGNGVAERPPSDDEIVVRLLSALGMVLTMACHAPVDKHMALEILTSAGLTHEDMATMYKISKARLRDAGRPV